MPILVRSRCYRRFASAVRAVMHWKRWGKVRASAYVAVIERRQRGSRKLKRACGG
jgi:hypothetical protein